MCIEWYNYRLFYKRDLSWKLLFLLLLLCNNLRLWLYSWLNDYWRGLIWLLSNLLLYLLQGLLNFYGLWNGLYDFAIDNWFDGNFYFLCHYWLLNFLSLFGKLLGRLCLWLWRDDGVSELRNIVVYF